MYLNRKKWGIRLYLILSGVFIASLVTCNLIFQKFFFWTPLSFLLDESNLFNGLLPVNIITYLGNYTFEISAGILPYPITFLVTDIISEIYGLKKANQVVTAGLVASMFMLIIVSLADFVTATSWSPVNNEIFHQNKILACVVTSQEPIKSIFE